MLNLKACQIERLEAVRRAAFDFFSTFSREEDLQEAERLLAAEMGLCAEEARGFLRDRREQR